jgi:hypothetical protein
MISLLVDESYAFDYLSILEMKSKLDPDNDIKKDNFNRCLNFLKCQMKDELFFSVLSSLEYQACYNANWDTFKAVDKAKADKVAASFVDRCNYQRHLAKQNLQKKFFGTTLNEIKIGYEVYEGGISGPRTSV